MYHAFQRIIRLRTNLMIKSLLEPALESGEFTIDLARKIAQADWRTMVDALQGELKREAESLFYFIEGYVEEVDEGFVDEQNDPELYERAKKLLRKL